MTDPIDDFMALREELERELAEYEEMVPKATARLELLRAVLRVPEVKLPEVGSWIEETFPKGAAEIDVYRYIRDHPGVGRPILTAEFVETRKSLENGALTNALGTLSKRKLIINKGGNRISSWFIAE